MAVTKYPMKTKEGRKEGGMEGERDGGKDQEFSFYSCSESTVYYRDKGMVAVI